METDGKMKNCLFSKGEIDLLNAHRSGENILPLIQQSLANKALALGGQFEGDYHQVDPHAITNRSMIKIGG